MKITQYRMGVAVKSQGRRGAIAPKAPVISLDQPGRLRVCHILAILGIAHQTLYQGLKNGRYPPPDGRDGRIPFWTTTTIRDFLANSLVQSLNRTSPHQESSHG